ncbi:hypothetical protein [Gaetbulibacter aestuarii]|uniref:Membrane or secreted protein n=1 Tax=Gaetbulibacter aestuarii TaxID=1502358 RepID=A0ABW7MYF2_9FLAO
MKTLIMIISISGLLLFNSCAQKPDTAQLLENENTRQEIFQNIVDNHDYMMSFMNTMQSSEHAMGMMQGNHMMMGNMMRGGGMHTMMKDSTMMKSMMTQMLTNKAMMTHMMQMMHNRGMMSNDCMENTLNMMRSNMMNSSNNN